MGTIAVPIKSDREPPPRGGGGGGKQGLIVLLVSCVFTGLLYYIVSPSYTMKIRNKSPFRGHKVILYLKNGFTHEEFVKHKNIDCLRQKGHNVRIFERRNRYSDNDCACVDSKEPIEKILEDCKQCDVHTEISYRFYDMFRNEITRKKSFRWHKQYQEELK